MIHRDFMCTKKKRIKKKKLDMEAPIIAALGKQGQEGSVGKASLDHRGELSHTSQHQKKDAGV